MPELPEVETVRRGLQPVLEGQRIVRVGLGRPDLRFPFPERFAERLAGRQVTALERRSKYLLLRLDGDETLLAHLGMSGSFRIEGGATPGQFHLARSRDSAHDHVVFDLQGGHRVIYNDPRRFGFMDLLATSAEERHPRLAGLGPEPLGNGFDASVLLAAFAGRAAPLKARLLDQAVVAGLGNIYVCEALWRAGLSPERAAGSVTGAEAERLVRAIRDVLTEAIAAGGSTLSDYMQADGSLGYFQHSFRVYDREDEPCRTPGCGGQVRRLVQSGRSTFFCEACQQ